MRQDESQTPDNREPSIVLGQEAVHVETTLSEKTRAHYALISRRLLHRYLRSENIPHETPEPEIDAESFVCFLLALASTWKASTWRMNRQACFRLIKDSHLAGREQAMEMLKHDATLRSVSSIEGRRDSRGSVPGSEKRATSSLKQKHISERELKRLIAWLNMRSRSTHAEATAIWLQVGILTGLRPTEWRDISINSTEKDPNTNEVFPDKCKHGLLRVQCAKNTNGRAFGVTRHLDITDFNDDGIKLIFLMKRYADKWRKEGTFDENQRSCSRLLASACKSLWPHKIYTINLYSARHQAIANWKYAGKDRVEISVLAGHAITETAGESYGRRSGGWKRLPIMPKPLKSEYEKGAQVDMMRNQIKQERLDAKTHANALARQAARPDRSLE